MQRNVNGHTSCNLAIVCSLFKFISGKSCFQFLRQRLPAPLIKRLNDLVKLRCKIAIQLEQHAFIKQCLRNNHDPVSYCKSLRRNRMRPTCSNLRRFAKCQLDANVDRTEKLRTTFNQRRGILSELSLICYMKFTKFSIETVSKTRVAHAQRLQKSLEHKLTLTEMPEKAER